MLLFNWGLHAVPGKQPIYDRDLRLLFDDHERRARNASLGGRPTFAVFLQTSAQHFDTRTGGFFSRPTGWQGSTPSDTWDVPDTILTWTADRPDVARPLERPGMPKYPCRPSTHTTATERWRNHMALSIFREKDYRYLHVLPVGELTESLWDAHVGTIFEKHLDRDVADCTHFCYNPMLLEAVAYLLLRIIRVAEARAAEDAAKFRPTRTPPTETPTAAPREADLAATTDHCANGKRNAGETDVDCGGSKCAPCTWVGARCKRSLRDCGQNMTCDADDRVCTCLLYTSPSPRDQRGSRMPSSA